MENTNIFIFSQGVPKVYPKSKEYKLVTLEPITDSCKIENIVVGKYDDPILKMEHAYSECARIHALWKHYPLPKYVGFNHYRRYFDFMENVPDLDEIFKEHDLIYQEFNIGWPSILVNYRACHCEKDLMRCIKIIKEKYPSFSEDADFVLENKFFVPCNVFITTREMFCDWCEFVFGVLDEYNNEMGFATDLDVYNHVVNHMPDYVDGKGGLPNSSTEYQTRIHAFLSERLSSIFFHRMSKNPYSIDIVLTETHFDFEKTYFNQYEKQNISDNN